ncbi:MAG TPA: ATP-binding protein [Candidatus Polarisedimenticolaceae bacterium]|nr:ATP-binding protein [Candidatus Polarisedimenticolaceae bacterium]
MKKSVRRTVQWSAAGLLALAILFGVYRSSLRLADAGPEMASSRQFLWVLTLAIVVLSLAFAGILIRNLVRLIVDRKRGILGARLRTKLVFFFLALVLVPAFLLSFGAGAFIKQTVEGLLRTPVEGVSRQAKEIVKEAGRREETRLVDHARLLASDLATVPEHGGDARRVAAIHWRQREGYDLVALTAKGGLDAFDAADRIEAPEVAANVRAAVLRLGTAAARTASASFDSVPLRGNVLLIAAAPLGASQGDRAAVVGTIVRPSLENRASEIDAAERAYLQFREDRRDLLRLYYSLIALVGLTIVFVASWIGFYLSRRITVPLGQMAAASREISEGNLGVRVLTNVGDEVGQLVEAFNEMAGQLQESREVITRNTAELRRSNAALDERRRYIETLVAQLSTAVVSLDRLGVVSTANPAASSMLGLSLEAGHDFVGACRDAGLDPLAALLDEFSARGAPALRRELLLERHGSSIAVTVHVSPLKGSAGNDLGTLVMIEDLTDLLEAQRAAAWREVARRIAHEIKNPLTPIQLAAQRLRKKWDDGANDLGEVVHDATATIEREVTGLKSLVDEFSLYARMPAPNPEPVDFAAIVRSVVDLYRVHPGIAWAVHLDDALGTVRVDRDQIRRALINLIDNAVAAMNGNGPIEVAAGPGPREGSVRVEIADRGPGVPSVLREKLFIPYFSTKPRGTGLGLAIVQRIVVEHGGTIRVEDNPGGGARFVVELPGVSRLEREGAVREATRGTADGA